MQNQNPVEQSTVADRVRLILEWTDKSARAFADSAGMSANAINTILQRNSDKVRPETLVKIAAAGGVRLEWLANGEGHPFELPPGVSPDADYPSRSLALGLAQMEQVSPAVVRRLRARRPESDPGAWFWVDLLRTLIAEETGGSGSGKKKATKRKE